MEKSVEELEYELGYKPSTPNPIFVGVLLSEKLNVLYEDCKLKLSLEDIANMNELLIAEALNNFKAVRVAKMRAQQKSNKNSPV